MSTIKALLRAKGEDVWSVGPDTSVYDAIKEMADREIGALLVRDGDTVHGILSERDYARRVILEGRSSRDTRVAEIMTTDVAYIDATASVRDGLGQMTERRVRHLPVMEKGRLAGMISIGDLVKAVIAEQEALIAQLERYITTGG